MLSNLKNKARFAALDLEGVQDGGELLKKIRTKNRRKKGNTIVELNIDDGTDDRHNLSLGLALGDRSVVTS